MTKVNRYTYVIAGTRGADGEAWAYKGTVECQWHDVFESLMRQVAEDADKSKCPFKMHSLTIFVEDWHENPH
jgi:hypothetical protein